MPILLPEAAILESVSMQKRAIPRARTTSSSYGQYTLALQAELKISELLKALDDAKIAAIPNAATSSGEDAGAQRATNNEQHLPREIEDVLERWERLVLGPLKKEPREDGPSVPAA